MAVDEVIAALFDLPVASKPLHDAASCISVVGYLSKFCADESCEKRPWITKSALIAFQHAVQVLAKSEPGEKIEWMPDYGCAVMKSTVGCLSGEVAINLISLDLHKFQTNSKLSVGQYSYIDTAVATDCVVLHIGTCTLDELPDRENAFRSLLSSVQSRTGDRRSARDGKQGHQRTAAFIHALYRQVFTSVEELPRGGFTDVGLHTGGEPCSTSGPLVLFALRQILLDYEAHDESISSDSLFKKIVSYFGLFVSSTMVNEYDRKACESNSPDVLLEYAFHILRSSSLIAAAASDDGLDMSFFVEWSRDLRHDITKLASEASIDYCEQYRLPSSDQEIRGHHENFSFNLPPPYSPAKDGSLSESEIRKKESQNLGWLNLPRTNCLKDIHTWTRDSVSPAKQDILLSMLAMRKIEALMWSYAKDLPVLEQQELDWLASLVDDYREICHIFKSHGKSSNLSSAQLKSRELLVVWVVKLNSSEMQGFGVPLDYNNLSHLVLSKQEEWEAVKRVGVYLGKYGTNKPVFSLKDENHTFDLGRRVANASRDMVNIWEEEESDAISRIEGHWKEVLRKQEEARKLRAEIAELNVKRAEESRTLDSKQRELDEHVREHARKERRSPSRYIIRTNLHRECESEVSRLRSIVNDLDLSISRKNASLTSALKAPSPVIQPLPKEKHKAMPIIFFLYMPPVFQLLSRFSFTAQQLLLPTPWDSAWGGREGSERLNITELVTRSANGYCQTSLKDHYNIHQNSQYHRPSRSRRGSDYHVLLRSLSDCVPQQIGSSSVDHMRDKNDGIWYPDQLRPRMAWYGGAKSFDKAPNGSEINPFIALDHFHLVCHFTDRLSTDTHLQWTLMQPGEANILPNRSNLPYARQNQKPKWLSKTEWLSFANLRSYPNIQLRNILIAIQDRELPFNETSLCTLINQSLFQLGDLTVSGSSSTLEWKRDLEDENFCKDSYAVLSSFFDEIKNTPKNYKCVNMLGGLCNFFACWEPSCRLLARQLAKSVHGWAEDEGQDIEKSPPSVAPMIRAKQVVLYQHAIMVLSNGSLDESDVKLLIEMAIKSKNLFTGSHMETEIRTNEVEIQYSLSQRVDDVLQLVLLSPNIITEALRSCFPRCPSQMKWNRWVASNGKYETQCFQSQSTNGSSYTVNLVTGEVLIDGIPPSRLPSDILKHPLYVRSFGERQFEVVMKDGFLETCRPAFNRFYRFSLGPDLKIYEFNKDESEFLELLGVTHAKFNWSTDIPPRLTNMHSHWLCRDKHFIVLRDIRFNDRNISYVVKIAPPHHHMFEPQTTKVKGVVKCVGAHHEGRTNLSTMMEDSDNMDTLVLHRSPALDILSKFEAKEFIHSLIEPSNNKMKFYFPRFKMTFELCQGVLKCQEITGYQLIPHLQTGDTLRGTSRYLLLENTNLFGHQMIVFPQGLVERTSTGIVDIRVITDCDAELLWYQYEFHSRFKFLETKQSRLARLQLVALHLATSSILPDKLLGMTGEERAIALIRQCWGNRPLNKQESLALNNIIQLARGVSPTISILCQDMKKSSQQLSFLYTPPDSCCYSDISQCFEGSAYLNNAKSGKLGSRCYLSKREEARVIGVQARLPSLPPRFTPDQILQPCPVDNDKIQSIQMELDQFYSENIACVNKRQKLQHSFPLDIAPSSGLEAEMMEELKESWDANRHSTSQNTRHLKVDMKALQALNSVKNRTTNLRQKAEKYALSALNERSEGSHWHSNAHEMKKIAGLVPSASIVDLARISVEPSLIEEFNPMLDDESRDRLVTSIIIWLQLCVYEDKLARMISFCDLGSYEDLMKELETKKVWNASEHPYWLVFEVENQIMIRQEQYKVAKHLIDNPGNVIQLNMGLGKTRVILPMLVLYQSFKRKSEGGEFLREKVTRLNFLSALFEEAYRYLQNHLTASILAVNIYTMPFCRDFQLNLASIERMKNALDNCQIDGGALVVAPEHRLSLELKAKELHRRGDETTRDREIAEQIDHLICRDAWLDILDECDELLRHRYQLIYAMGTPCALPGGAHRFRAIQALCHALTQNNELRNCLQNNGESCKYVMKSSEQWPEVQFYEGESLDIMLGDGFLSKVVDAIITNPPHELKWMQEHSCIAEIKKAIVDQDYSSALGNLHEDHLSDVLALRGLVTGGVFRHCLLKRHRVNYGIARPGKKRLAVPFRFADTPDERSEFAHPDCAIAFTVLAYYYDGLSKRELIQALRVLDGLGDNAKRNFYKRWLQISSDQMERVGPDIATSLDCIEKIDLSNDIQMEALHDIYHKNMATVDFYLNYCVFPTETDQFDSRLTATSWNLAQNPSNSIVGFSGTNDNWRILPLQVKQYFASHYKDSDPILKSLDRTNGRMLEVIVANTVSVEQLSRDPSRSKSLIEILKKSPFHALIDCGALLAGVELADFSKQILSLLPPKDFGGVLYFDNAKHKDWVVLERSGRVLPKDISPVTEKDAFAIFDEPRCRGTDLKLRKDAVALLTLAPHICKDKLMQSAGRLRKLGQGQKLVMVGGSDVFTQLNEVKRGNSSSQSSWAVSLANRFFKATAVDILSWSMKNTVESTAAGLLNWANQAFFFASTFGKDPLLCITDEVLELGDMYGKSFAQQTIIHSSDKALEYHYNRSGGEDAVNDSMKAIIRQTKNRINEYGGDFNFPVRGCDEECERELEMEVEEEEEIEVELPLVDPIGEKNWNFWRTFDCRSPTELPITVHQLSSFVQKFVRSKGSDSIKWAKNIYTTANFAKTITCSANASLSRYLRIVNFVLCFPDESILLLSEYEANNLLRLFWDPSCSGRGRYHLLHASLMRRSLDESNSILLHCSLPKSPMTRSLFEFGKALQAIEIINDESMSSLQLFAGETTYVTEERRNTLKSILRLVNVCPMTQAKQFVEIRGKDKLFPYSDLEMICEQLLCEL